MIDGKIHSARFVPKEAKVVILGEVLESEVEERFYLGESIDRWTYMKGAKDETRVTSEGFEYRYREGAVGFPHSVDLPARTMLTSEASVNRSTHVVNDSQTNRLRVLTPIECERLNGFDDNWTNIGMTEKFRYFCMGNALVVSLVERMGTVLGQIFELEN